jgi:hypothetical protein
MESSKKRPGDGCEEHPITANWPSRFATADFRGIWSFLANPEELFCTVPSLIEFGGGRFALP